MSWGPDIWDEFVYLFSFVYSGGGGGVGERQEKAKKKRGGVFFAFF